MHIPYSKISSHSQFQPLKEVWVGNVYPDRFYSHLDNQAEDVFCHISELTRKDLKNLVDVLTKLNVSVVQPTFSELEFYLDEQNNLLKPPITPCDFALTLGDTLYVSPQYSSGVEPFQNAIDLYRQNQQKVVVLDRGVDPMAWVEFASVVRVGRDILIDYDSNDIIRTKNNKKVAEQLCSNYRVHLSTTGDHSDGVFCPLKPGQILSSHYQTHYEQSFPDWNIFSLRDNTLVNKQKLTVNGVGAKWWLPGVDYAHFNPAVVEIASQWLGQPEETIFNVNNLVVDEHNIIVSGHDESTFNYFERIGLTPHVVDFATKYFWDAGIHCCTSDIYREGDCEDYWPNRGTNGIYELNEWI